MSYTIGVPRETTPGERLVSLTPDVVTRLIKAGASIKVESGAGAEAHHPDKTYESAGATIVGRAEAFCCDVVAKVRPPLDDEIGLLKSGGALVSFLSPLDAPEICTKLAAQGTTAISMELVPRISRAQKMDALSALSGIAGYKSVLMAANLLPKFFPLLTTAAGTVKPANVLVLGAGVAGLQAIATARRLGARVSAYDIREAVREEIHSLGATFVELEIEVDKMQDSGGYAKALVAEKAKRQTELLVPFIGNSDVVVTTALIPGRAAPVLITEDAVKAMAPGSVIVDLAASNGGNCALTEPGETVVRHGVTIVGSTNITAGMAVHATQLYARTVFAIISDFTSEQGFVPNFEDDVFKGACVTHDGAIVHDRVNSILQSA